MVIPTTHSENLQEYSKYKIEKVTKSLDKLEDLIIYIKNSSLRKHHKDYIFNRIIELLKKEITDTGIECRATGEMPILQRVLEFFGYKPKS